MRHKILTVVAAGAVGATGFALAGPALASSTSPTASAATAATSQVDRIRQALAGLVTDKTLTQAQADKVAETLGSADLGRGGFRGHHGRGGRGLAAAATALKTTEAELRTALEGGKTLAEVAKDKGVPVGTLVDALVKAEKERLAQAVKDGVITQAHADEHLKDLVARVTEKVNSTPRLHHGHRSGEGHRFGPAPSDTATATPST